MGNVNVRCNGFAGSYAHVNGDRVRNISTGNYLRSILTLGMQRWSDFFSYGIQKFMFRFGIALSGMALLKNSDVGLCLSDSFHQLDMSEKGASSYWYGMAMAKLIAENELDIPWLAYVDQLKMDGALTTSSTSASRGDLVGKGAHGDWHVIEAKGRSNPCGYNAINKAKAQAAKVISVDNQAPVTNIACITLLYDNPISIVFEDPPASFNEDGIKWNISEENFIIQYYKNIIKYISMFPRKSERNVNNVSFRVAPILPSLWDTLYGLPFKCISRLQLHLGLLSSIYDNPQAAYGAVTELQFDDSFTIGRDGIAIFGKMHDWDNL